MKRRLLFSVLFVAAVWVLVARRGEVGLILAALAAGDFSWIVLAGVLQLAFYLCYTGIYWTSFHAVGLTTPFWPLAPVMLGSLAINVTVPGAGPALFIDHAARHGESATRAAAGAVLVRVTDFGTFALILAVAMVHLARQGVLEPHQIAGAVGLAALVGGWSLVLILGLLSPRLLRRLLRFARRVVNRLCRLVRRPPAIDADWPERATHEYVDAAGTIMEHPRRLWVVLLVCLLTHAVDLVSLRAVCAAFHEPVSLATLVAAFSMAMLFWIVAVTPQGIGVVEGTIALVLASLGVEFARATAIALAFRGLTFWLPLGLGFLCLPRLVKPARGGGPAPAA